MKIVHFNEMGGFFGGVEKYTFQIANALNKKGHTNLYAHCNRDGLDSEKFFSAFADRIHVATPAELSAWLTAQQPDVLVVHKVDHVDFLEVAVQFSPTLKVVHDVVLVCPRRHKYFHFSGRSCKYPVSWRCYPCGGFIAKNHEGLLPIKFVSIASKRREMDVSKQFTRLLAPSDYIKHELVQNSFPVDKIQVSPHGIPADKVKLDHESAQDPPRILFVGSILRGKGIDLLLKVATRLQQSYHLDLVGQGNGFEKYQKMAQKLNLTETVTFHGWVSPADVDQFYRQARLVTFTSRAPESFGLVGVEAMAHGCPVVGFDVGGVSTWLKDGVNGYLLPEGDLDGFARRVDQLLADAEMAERLGNDARQYVLEHFTYDHYVEQFTTLLDELAGAHG